ncbi:MAG: hypothetical protein ACRC0X_09350 [Brevinema sp.]
MQEKIKTSFLELFYSLQMPLKETSKNFVIIVTAIGEVFDTLVRYSEQMITRYFIQSEQDLELFAKDRGIQRIKYESMRSFQGRVLNAYTFLKNSSTKVGIEGVIKRSIEKNFEIKEIYQDNFILDHEGEILEETTYLSDDNFYFVVKFYDPLTVEEDLYLKEIIELYKPAHIGYHLEAMILDDFILDDDNEQLEINTYLEQ